LCVCWRRRRRRGHQSAPRTRPALTSQGNMHSVINLLCTRYGKLKLVACFSPQSIAWILLRTQSQGFTTLAQAAPGKADANLQAQHLPLLLHPRRVASQQQLEEVSWRNVRTLFHCQKQVLPVQLPDCAMLLIHASIKRLSCVQNWWLLQLYRASQKDGELVMVLTTCVSAHCCPMSVYTIAEPEYVVAVGTAS